HQILPLKLENNNLLLGIVNPEDREALDYVNSILVYMNCAIATEIIRPEIHRDMLSAYLNHKNTSTEIDSGKVLDLNEAANDEIGDTKTNSSEAEISSSPPEQLSVDNVSSSLNSFPERENIQITSLNRSFTESKSVNYLPVLQLPQRNSSISIDQIVVLPPRRILEELLARVVTGGIGRLYLERRPYHGRILWSENGAIQSILEELQLSLFQGVLNELKRFTNQSIATITEVQQIEKEYIYQKQRVLLRLRIMPGMYGEEATLQVLRGAALKFYQNQQVSRLSEDVLSISQRLSYKLHELQGKLLRSSSKNPERIESLKSLNRLLKNLDRQIKSITC
nr:pilus assembly protein PilB [Mastigocoleus sp. MO_167.B18]